MARAEPHFAAVSTLGSMPAATMGTFAQYTPLEVVILSQSLATHGTDPTALSRISTALREHPLLREQDGFDPSKLDPVALQAASQSLLEEEVSRYAHVNGTGEMNGLGRLDGAMDSGSRKHRLSNSPQQAGQGHGRPNKVLWLGDVAERLYLEYQDRLIQDIRRDEEHIRDLQREIEEIEEGRWDQRLMAEAAASEAEATELPAQSSPAPMNNRVAAQIKDDPPATVPLSPSPQVTRSPSIQDEGLVAAPTQHAIQSTASETNHLQETVLVQPEVIAQPVPLQPPDPVTITPIANTTTTIAAEPANMGQYISAHRIENPNLVVTPLSIDRVEPTEEKAAVPSPKTPTEPPYSPLSEVDSLQSPSSPQERTVSLSPEKFIERQPQPQSSPIRPSVQSQRHADQEQTTANNTNPTRPVSEIQDSFGGAHTRTRSQSRLTLETTSVQPEDGSTMTTKVKEEEPPTPATVTGPTEIGVTTRARARRSLDTDTSIHHDGTSTAGAAHGKHHHQRKRDNSMEPSATPDIPEPSSSRTPAAAATAPTMTTAGLGPRMIMTTRNFPRTTAHLLHDISTHRFASMFAGPVKEKDAPGYRDLVYRPQDLKSIKSAIAHGSRAVAAILGAGGMTNAVGVSTTTTKSEASAQGSPAPVAAATTPLSSSSRFPTSTNNHSNNNNNSNNNIIYLPATPDIVPPKGIVNSAQLEKELMRMFANAVMFNPDPKGGLGGIISRSRRRRRRRQNRRDGNGTGEKNKKRRYVNGPWLGEDVDDDDGSDGDEGEGEGEVAPGPYLEQHEDDVGGSEEEGDEDEEDGEEDGEDNNGHGYEYEEGGVVRDTREMFEAVQEMVTNWRQAERATVVETSASTSMEEGNGFYNGDGKVSMQADGDGSGAGGKGEGEVKEDGVDGEEEDENEKDNDEEVGEDDQEEGESQVEYVSADDGDGDEQMDGQMEGDIDGDGDAEEEEEEEEEDEEENEQPAPKRRRRE